MAEQLNEPRIKQGWIRAVTFFVFYVLIMSGLSWLLEKMLAKSADASNSVDPAGAEQSRFLVTVIFITLVSLSLIWLFRKFIDRQKFQSLGYAWKNNRNDAATGALAAMAMLGIGTLVLVITHHLTFTGWNGNLKYLFFNLVLMLLVAVTEETIFRGYLLNNLMQSLDKWVALGISAVLFTIVHLGNNALDVLPILEIFIGGVMLGINYIFTRNLWFGIALHLAWNFLQGPVLGYQVSGLALPSLLQQEVSGPAWLTGGAFGFEGSILAILLNGGLVVLLVWLYSRQQERPNEKLPS